MSEAGRDHDCAVSPVPRPQKLLGRLVSPVVDAVDPDALLDRVDLNDLVARVDIDAALRRVDIDQLVTRIDLDALLERVDVDAIVRRVDVNAVVQRVDVDAILQRVDIDNIVRRVRVGGVVADTATQISSRSLESARRAVARLDGVVQRPIDRAAGRDRDPDRAVPPGLAGPVARLERVAPRHGRHLGVVQHRGGHRRLSRLALHAAQRRSDSEQQHLVALGRDGLGRRLFLPRVVPDATHRRHGCRRHSGRARRRWSDASARRSDPSRRLPVQPSFSGWDWSGSSSAVAVAPYRTSPRERSCASDVGASDVVVASDVASDVAIGDVK